MSYTDRYYRTWNGPFAFTQVEISKIPPRMMGVYQLLYPNEQEKLVAYIGIATGATIKQRLSSHFNGRGNWAAARLARPEDWEFIYYECSATDARQIEAHVVSDDKPPFNVRPEYRHYIPSISIH
ncbi:MAG TPA: GIY-YIG nuclease family protein [Granulicella sp.]